MVFIAPEPIDVTLWPLNIQKTAHTELGVVLGITPGTPDLPSMSDEELMASLAAVVAEIKTRPNATIKPCESIVFGPSTIIAGT